MTGGRNDLLLPVGARLLHIGPHKTGTSAVQSAFHAHRRELAEQGVHYAGPNRQPMQAAHAITGKPSPYHDGKAPPRGRWKDLVREIERAREPRVVISSEGFADADDDGIRTVIGDLGRERTHVVVTLRRLTNLFSSQWQQYVQGGLVVAYDEWLDAVLNGPGTVTPSFWLRHRHDRLVRRWADVAGTGNVTVVVADEDDRDRLFRVFEALVGLGSGTLLPEPDLANRSLTRAEVEVVRTFNRAFRAEGLGTQLHTKLMRFGAAEHLKRRPPAADEPRITTPDWALQRGRIIEREIVDGIAATGVRVIGDLAKLAEPGARGRKRPARVAAATPEAPAPQTPDEVWATVGATAAMGIVLASGFARGAGARAGSEAAWPDGPIDLGTPPPRPRVEPLELARLSTPLLGVVLVRRVVGATLGRLWPRRRAA